MVIEDTLLIRHLPQQLSYQEKEEFLKHFGAKEVKIVGPENKKCNLFYAKYESSDAAQVALKRLHQLEVLGHLLCVELARDDGSTCERSHVHSHLQQIEKQDYVRRQREAFLQKLNSWTKLVDLNFPPPVHLHYQYSPPTSQVLDNICKALTNVPKFYTQVLHLMNKMNLPCPFTKYYPLESHLSVINKAECLTKEVETELTAVPDVVSDEESEIESDPDDRLTKVNSDENIVNLKRKKSVKTRVKRPKFVKPVVPVAQTKSTLRPEEVFEKTDIDPLQRKIELKLTPGLHSIQESKESQEVVSESFGIIHSVSKAVDKEENAEINRTEADENIETCISSEALAANRISSRDQRVLPVFKNYQTGAPSCRLYIKNLAKQVVAKDLHFIFRRYTIPQEEGQGNMFDIRLMQEGRMKGQAFVSLQSVELAQKALKETNGFILKDKPMVVQFARSATVK